MLSKLCHGHLVSLIGYFNDDLHCINYSIEQPKHTHLYINNTLRVYLVGGVEKCENRKDFNFSPFCLVGSGKVEGWKK